MIKTAMFLLGAAFFGSVMAKSTTIDTNKVEQVLESNIYKVTIDVAHVANAVQSLATNVDMDELVAQSLHEDDRRFSRIG